MNIKNVVLILGIVMVFLGTILMFTNGRGTELSDAEIKKRAEMLGMVEQNKDAILTSELEGTEDNDHGDEIQKGEPEEMDGKESEGEKTLPGDDESQENKTEDEQDGNNLTLNIDNKTEDNGKQETAQTKKKTGKTTKKKTSKKKKSEKKNTKKQTQGSDTVTVKINVGMTAAEICGKLEEEGLIEDAKDFRQYLVEKKIQRKLQAGTFEINKQADYDEIVSVLYKG